MTLGTLINMSKNITDKTRIMIYNSTKDFEMSTCNWESCRAWSVKNSEILIDRFEFIDENLIAVSIA